MIRDRQKVAGETFMEGYRRAKARSAAKLVTTWLEDKQALAWISELADRDVTAAGQRGTRRSSWPCRRRRG